MVGVVVPSREGCSGESAVTRASRPALVPRGASPPPGRRRRSPPSLTPLLLACTPINQPHPPNQIPPLSPRPTKSVEKMSMLLKSSNKVGQAFGFRASLAFEEGGGGEEGAQKTASQKPHAGGPDSGGPRANGGRSAADLVPTLAPRRVSAPVRLAVEGGRASSTNTASESLFSSLALSLSRERRPRPLARAPSAPLLHLGRARRLLSSTWSMMMPPDLEQGGQTARGSKAHPAS